MAVIYMQLKSCLNKKVFFTFMSRDTQNRTGKVVHNFLRDLNSFFLALLPSSISLFKMEFQPLPLYSNHCLYIPVNISWKCHTTLLLISFCPELSHVITHSYRERQEMLSLFGVACALSRFWLFYSLTEKNGCWGDIRSPNHATLYSLNGTPFSYYLHLLALRGTWE